MLKDASKNKLKDLQKLILINNLCQEKLDDKSINSPTKTVLEHEIALNNAKLSVEISKLLAKSQLKQNNLISSMNKDIKNFIGTILAKAESKPKLLNESIKIDTINTNNIKQANTNFNTTDTNKYNNAKLMLRTMAKEFKTNELIIKNTLRYIWRNLELFLTLGCNGGDKFDLNSFSHAKFNNKNLNSFINLLELDLKTNHDRLFTNKFVTI